jgi:hypothetical protein
MEIFRVPQREIEVRITMEDGETLQGVLYVPATGQGGGPGRLGDRLNDENERFIPVALQQQALLVNKTRIMLVELPQGEAEGELQEAGSCVERGIEVEMKGGVRLAGRLKYTMPVERERILDYMNAAPMFIPMLQDGRVVLLNGRYLVSLKDLGSRHGGQREPHSG